MANDKHRYRITVTPIEQDGQACSGRCTIEFEHSCHDDWMRILEASQRQRGLTGDERFEPDDVRPVEELAYRVAIAVTNDEQWRTLSGIIPAWREFVRERELLREVLDSTW